MQVYVPLNTPGVDLRADQGPSRGRSPSCSSQEVPDLVVAQQTKALREGKVLVDWSQNDEHKTTVSVYSLRARERPTVSTPLTWDEVRAARAVEDLTFETADVLARVAEHGDLFAPVESLVQALPGS